MLATHSPAVHTVKTSAVLNFVVVGQVRSGAALIQSALDKLSEVTCHDDLFHADAKIRQRVHERYFGPAPSPALPTWFVPPEMNPYQYLSRQIFDQNVNAESAIGVRLTYDQVQQHQFYDLLHDRCHEGDFCLIHVRRNPVAAYVSQQQAVANRLFALDVNDRTVHTPPQPIAIDPKELTAFVRNHESVAGKIQAACDDTLDITYRELCRNFGNTMKKVLDFLELPPSLPVMASYRRLPNNDMPKRIANFDELRQKVPADVREFLTPGTLY